MTTVQEPDSQNQAAHPSEISSETIPPKRKVGVEIVRSANLASRFFRGRRATSYSVRNDDDALWARRVARAMR
jgi:hypothetical protein